MSKKAGCSYKFGPFSLDSAERKLVYRGEAVALTHKAFEILLILIENHGRLVEKSELIERVWPDTFIEEKTLAQNVFTLRKALGLDEHQQYIETVPKHGYRFVAAVQVVGGGNNGEQLQLVQEKFAAEGPTREGLPPPNLPLPSNDCATEGPDLNESAARSSTHLQSAGQLAGREKIGNRKLPYNIAAAVIALLIVAGFTFYLKKSFSHQKQSGAQMLPPFKAKKVVNLTTHGHAWASEISPDGKFVAYVFIDGAEQSLRLRQVSAKDDIQIVAPDRVMYRGVSFSPDGNYIYFTTLKEESITGSLYRVSVLGGAAKLLLEGINSPVSFSPDGNRIAFVSFRASGEGRESALAIANSDGSQQTILAVRKDGEFYSPGGPDWSPDGSVLACGASNRNAFGTGVVEVRLSDGAERYLTSQTWPVVGNLVWLRDGSGLVFNATDDGSETAMQLWYLSYRTGDVQKITNGLNAYGFVSLTSDSGSLAAIQYDRYLNMRIAPGGEVDRARPLIADAGGKFGAVRGFSWSPEGQVVYSSNEKGNFDLWSLEADGKNKKQLTTDEHYDLYPAVSPDGRHVAFISDRGGRPQVWRMDIDGNNRKQLTNGHAAIHPTWSPDGKWIVFTSLLPNPTIWRVPSEGGPSVRLTDKYSYTLSVSHDGRLISCYYWDDQTSHLRLAIVPFEGGPPLKMFEPIANSMGILPASCVWATGDRALLYVNSREGVQSIWRQPLTGGAPQRLTDLREYLVDQFAWSPDGRNLLYTRRAYTSDVILISGLRE